MMLGKYEVLYNVSYKVLSQWWHLRIGDIVHVKSENKLTGEFMLDVGLSKPIRCHKRAMKYLRKV